MTTTVADFRALFPEFTIVAYADASIQAWLTQAESFVGEARWGSAANLGRSLWVAHYLLQNAAAAQSLGTSGGISQTGGVGILNRGHVDAVEFGYDTTTGTIVGAGHWNNSSYGVRFYQLMQQFGLGGIQVGPHPSTICGSGGGSYGLYGSQGGYGGNNRYGW